MSKGAIEINIHGAYAAECLCALQERAYIKDAMRRYGYMSYHVNDLLKLMYPDCSEKSDAAAPKDVSKESQETCETCKGGACDIDWEKIDAEAEQNGN